MTSTENEIINRWVLICGLVRDEASMLAKLDELRSWLDQGVIQGVVFSTWHGEIHKFPNVLERFHAGDFILVETEQPTIKSFGYTLHQSKTLYYGLQAIPKGAMVLKIRADLGGLNAQVRAAIESVDLDLTTPEGWPEVFEKKILLSTSFIDAPFYLNDIIFYGLREDLINLSSFDFSTEMIFANTAPEQFFFRGAFARQFPLLESYLTIQPYLVHDDKIRSAQRINTLLESDYYLDVLSLNLKFMRTYFRFGIIDPIEREALPEPQSGFSVHSLFNTPNAVAGATFLPGPHAVMITDERVLDALIQRRFANDDLGARLSAAFDRTAQNTYWRSFSTNPLRPDPAIVELGNRIRANTPEILHRLDGQNDTSGRHFVVRGHSDRVGLTIQTDETQKLHEEINHMRRQLDALRAGGKA